MAPPIPLPKFVKRVHHVVPAGWQRRFHGFDPSGNTQPGPFYKNIVDGTCLGPIGPGDRMSQEYANIVFDEFYRPSDAIEDRLSVAETNAIKSLDAVIATSKIRPGDKVDLGFFLALQACRYPELYNSRLDLGRLFAIVLGDVHRYADAAALNGHLRASGLLPGAAITPSEFGRLATSSNRQAELETILTSHGYEPYFNIGLVLAAALPLAEHLLGLEWQLVAATKPSFVLSDRPVPARQLGYQFSVGLSASLAVRFTKASQPLDDRDVIGRLAQGQTEIDDINREVRGRAREWICGPCAWVHAL